MVMVNLRNQFLAVSSTRLINYLWKLNIEPRILQLYKLSVGNCEQRNFTEMKGRVGNDKINCAEQTRRASSHL